MDENTKDNTTRNTPLTQHFDLNRVRRAFDRAAGSYDEFAVLQNEVCQRLLEKLDIVKMVPETILDAGSGTGFAIPGLFERYKKARLIALDLSENMLARSKRHGGLLRSPHLVCGNIEQLPFADHSFDLLFSSLSMQWCNDLDAVIREAGRVLKPGGLYVFTTFGPDTLKELRQSWAAVDDTEHVNRFIDMHDIGDALLQQGYAEPVMEAEILTLTYESAEQIMTDLKAIGANVTSGNARHGLGGKAAIEAVCRHYERFRENGLLPASYEIIYGHAWKPEGASGRDAPQKVHFQRF